MKTLITLIRTSWEALVESIATTAAGERTVRDIALVR